MRNYVIIFLIFLFQNVFAPNLTIEQIKQKEKEKIEIETYKKSQTMDLNDSIVLSSLRMSKRFNKAERMKIRDICKRQGIKSQWLYRIFSIESGGNPQAVNYQKGDPIDPWKRVLLGRATGLIQWLPSSAINCGTTTKDLFRMNILEQLNYVERYLIVILNGYKIKNFSDLYLAILRPIAIGKPNNFIVGKKGGIVFKQNQPLDMNKDSVITVHDVKKYIQKRHPEYNLIKS